MSKIFVTGMPRSGTSMMSNILTKMGCDFICGHETIDDIYNPIFNPDGYFQRKNIHFISYNRCIYLFDEKNMKIDLAAADFRKLTINDDKFIGDKIVAIKDPYLLYILKDIIDDGIAIVMIRNLEDTIKSCKKFDSNCTFKDDIWLNYYKKFIDISPNIKYIIVDYDKLLSDPISTYTEFCDKILPLVPALKKIDINSVVKVRKSPILTSSNYIHQIIRTNTIKDFDINKCMKYKPNDKCFCNSGKKYKICCSKY